jgi:hypothetical protein
VDKVGYIRVAPDGVHEMVAALAVHIAVAALGDDHHGRVGRFDPCGRGQRSAVEPVEEVTLQVMGSLGRLADP